MTARLYGWLLALAGVLVLGAALWLHGDHHGRQAQKDSDEARQLKAHADQLEADKAALQQSLDKARAIAASDQRTVQGLHDSLVQQRQATDALLERISHVRLAVPRPRTDPGACAAGADGAAAQPAVAGDGGVGVPGAGGAGLAAAPVAPPGVGGDGDRVALTLAAVGLYDSALYPGEPGAPELGAVACRAVGTAGAAADAYRCEGFAGLFLDDLFRVHAANAASCAADRQRLGRLIEAIRARERTYGVTREASTR